MVSRGLLIVALVLAACGGGSDGASAQAESPTTSPAYEPSIDSFCVNFTGMMLPIVDDLLKQTITGDEAVEQLDEVQTALERDLPAFSGEAARDAQRIVDDVARLKVAIDGAGSDYMSDPDVVRVVLGASDTLQTQTAC